MTPADAWTDELNGVVARSSGMLLAADLIDSLLRMLTATVVQTIPVSDGAGVTLLDPRGNRTTTAATDPWVSAADALQYELDEGPCLSAWRQRQAIRCDDLVSEHRWAGWTRAAREVGVASVLSAPLVAGDSAVGAVKVYAKRSHVFDHDHESTLTMFAAQSALLVANAQAFHRAGELSPDLTAMLAQRDDLARACGVLMGREQIPEQAAFDYLIARSRSRGCSVHEAARELLHAHDHSAARP